MKQPVVPPPGVAVDLSAFDPGYTGGLTKEDAHAERRKLRRRLGELQDLLYADRRFGLLVVLQGIDTSGKDSTVRSVFEQVGPLGCTVTNFGVPSSEEAAHDFLWRYHEHAPERGKIAIFNRSHYEAVLVERVKGIVPELVWRPRFEQINRFERMLEAERIEVMKFFLFISREEQRARLQERIDNSRKHWKFRRGDLEDRELWDEHHAAYEDALNYCNTDHAPWHIVPSDRKWVRDVVVLRALVARLEALDLRFPPSEDDLAGLVVA
jgi:PPK2 family polyphosphate:nucleotide phosphotransferase